MINKSYKDKDGNRRTLADMGATWASSELLSSLGWTEVSQDYQPPAPVPDKTLQIAALDAEYENKYNAIIEKIGRATAMSKQEIVSKCQQQYATLMAEHKEKKEAIVNAK